MDLLRHRRDRQPEHRLYTFLPSGDEEGETLTVAALDRAARRIAATLVEAGCAGERVLLLYPSGLDFVAAFFGCLYAGVVAVPAYPPRSRRRDDRLLAILADARPRALLTHSSSLARVEGWLDTCGAPDLMRIASDRLPEEAADRWRPRPADPDRTAFLQYTSGSTSTPKGVMVTHRNLVHNSELIRTGFAMDEGSVVVGWLPMFHDMGLIGNVLQPLFCGGRAVLMPPVAFLQKPLRWLAAISRYGADTSGGPDFAYDLCCRRIRAEDRRQLDLGGWRVAFDGSEPVRAETLERFAEAFAICGFRRRAFLSCYGLAEATLFVSGTPPAEPPRLLRADAAALERGRAVEALDGGIARGLISSGSVPPGHRVRVVEPASRRPLPPRHVGEIWLSGSSVARGYWGREGDTAAAFRAFLADGEGPFLRTGDLGFLDGGELFVTGRSKDLIVIRGRNHYPQDLELTAASSHPAVPAACCAAFSVEALGRERLVIVHEVERGRELDLAAVADAVRAAIAREHRLQVFEVVAIRFATLPKTSSGKIRRGACRELYLEDGLAVIGRSRLGGGENTPELLAALGWEAPAALGGEESRRVLVDALSRRVAKIAGSATAVAPDRPLAALGLDSLGALEVASWSEETFGATIAVEELFSGATVEDLADRILARSGGTADAVEVPTPAGETEGPLSWGQEALWFLRRLAPDSAAYHLAAAAELRPRPEPERLARCLRTLASRHAVLTTVYRETGRGVVQRIEPGLAIPLVVRDGECWSDDQLRRELGRLAEAPFDLETAAPMRVDLFRRRSAADVLLVTMHHMAGDLASLLLLVSQLAELYAEREERPSDAEGGPSLRYLDFVTWQRRRIAGEAGERSWEYWRGQLGGDLPVVDLPTDRPRPAIQTYRGAVARGRLPAEVAAPLRALAARQGTTLFAVLLAGFSSLLGRLGAGEELIVGSPASGRVLPELEGLIGYLANPLPLRIRASGQLAFDGLVAAVGRTVREALVHQEMPFPVLAERLQPQRDPSRSPLFQVLFSYQSAAGDKAGLAAFAVGREGAEVDLGPFTLRAVEVPRSSSQLDLGVSIAPDGDGLAVMAEYNSDLFDGTTARRLIAQLERLLAAAGDDPARRLESLPLLSREEMQQLVRQWNDTGRPLPAQRRVDELVRHQAMRTPDSVAVQYGDECLSYGELAARADALARRLGALGVGPEVPVGLHLEPGLDLPVALLAILGAGGAYVPLDPALPAERLALIAGDAGLACILTGGGVASLPAGSAPVIDLAAVHAMEPSAEAPDLGDATADAAAYVLYTSGSTGRPKGVVVPHRAVVAFLAAMAEAPGLSPGESLLAVTSLSFDISVLEIFLPLCRGGRVVLVPRRTAADGAALAGVLGETRPDVLQGTPATWKLLLESGWQGGDVRRLLCGGETLSRDLAAALSRRGELWNLYGPTETTVWSTVARVPQAPPGELPVSVGRPIANTRAYVVDRRLEVVPVGVPGELCIGGRGVARGYLGRPAATAERFVPDPFAADAGSRLYRTGDRARWRALGELELLGRSDDQLKVRGFRVEPGEIEAALRRHAQVADAVVASSRVASGEDVLTAYVVAAPKAAPDADSLRRHLEGILPSYMVPSAWVVLDRLPLTSSGKVDRRRLPAPPAALRPRQVPFVAPRNPREALVAGIWSELLRVDRVGMFDDFFTLGGHSLIAARMVARLREELEVDLPIECLFRGPTVAAVAAEVAARAPQAPVAPIAPADREGPLPLSIAQERLWLVEQLRPGTSAYHMAAAIRMSGPLRPAALAAALSAVVRRHEALRTTVAVVAGQPEQRIREPRPTSPPVVDLAALPAGRRQPEVRVLTRQVARRGFHLGRRPPLRLPLLRLDPLEHVLLLVAHHLLADGQSVELFLDELAVLYAAAVEARPAPLPAIAVQYADYALWQRRHLGEERLAEAVEDWRRRLAGAPAVELPTDRPRPLAGSSRGALLARPLPAAVARGVREIARRCGTTSFMVVLAAYAALLARYAGRGDVTVAVPAADRDRPQLVPLIGMFVHLLPVRIELADGPGFEDLLGRVRQAVLDAYGRRHVPLERLLGERGGGSQPGRHPLFRVTLAEEHALAERLVEGLRWSPEPVATGSAKFDLGVVASWRGDRLELVAELDRDLFDAATVERLLGHLEVLLADALARPLTSVERLDLLTPAESRQLLAAWNETAVSFGGSPFVHRRVAEHVRRSPARPAVWAGERRLSYGELGERASRLAAHLRRRGVGPETVVGVYVDRSPDLVVALLGVLEAGAAYLPLDPRSPVHRLERMIAVARAPVVVSVDRLAGELSPGRARIVVLERDLAAAEPLPPAALEPEGLAYVVFTSGSTGEPKGVAVTHRGLANLVDWHLSTYGVTSEDRASHVAALGFDASVWELWPYLAAGAAIDLLPDGGLASADDLVGWLDEREVTVAFLPTPVAEAALDLDSPAPRRLRAMLTGGDRLRRRPRADLPYAVVNHYGPTESTVVATAADVDAAGVGAPPIGRPIANLRAHVLDRHLQPVPVGVAGELYVGGSGLARGYLGRPGETARRFVPDPFSGPGGRLYRTGDRVRYLGDGQLDFLGRIDHQVQVRGVRVEPGEIEAVIADHGAVREALVDPWTPAAAGGEQRLAAYVVPAPGQGLDLAELRAFLRRRLLPEMVPAAIVVLERLPLTPHGKIDRAALPDPATAQAVSEGAVAPRSSLEAWLAEQWSDLLGVGAVGVHDDFFALGGHSLQISRMASRVRERFGVELRMREVFEQPTVADLAVRVAEALVQQAAANEVDAAFAEMGVGAERSGGAQDAAPAPGAPTDG